MATYNYWEGERIKLHEKLGFQHEGRLRRMIYTGGEFHDEIYMGMTREEFAESISVTKNS